MLEQLQNDGIVVLNEQAPIAQTTVLVVGVTRCGTTMIAKALGQMGVYFGVEVDEPVSEDLLLAGTLEMDSDSLPRIIEADNAVHDIWAFKRPTAYQLLEPSLFRYPRFVVSFRDLVAIAGREEVSMVSDFRGQFRRAALWSVDLTESFLRQTVPTMLVSYEKALLRPKRLISVLGRFLGLDIGWLQSRRASAAIRPSPADYLAKSQVRFPRVHHERS